ncbi:MAG: hypothetical protein ACRD3P_11850 [Terriglobales bacterium]
MSAFRNSPICYFIEVSHVSTHSTLLSVNGENLHYLPLTDRKHRLRGLIPPIGERLLYCDHVEREGQTLFDFVCRRDLEGIVAKRKFDPYLLDGNAVWLKIRNKAYSQWAGREELFERERSGDPVWGNWNSCAEACEQVGQIGMEQICDGTENRAAN